MTNTSSQMILNYDKFSTDIYNLNYKQAIEEVIREHETNDDLDFDFMLKEKLEEGWNNDNNRAYDFMRENKLSYDDVLSIEFLYDEINFSKPKRINVLNPDFMDEIFTAQDFKNSIVIFDDVDVFPKHVKNNVMNIVNSILQIGRHYNVSICFTVHNPNKELRQKSF